MQKQFCQYTMPSCSLTTQGDVKCLRDKMTTAAFNSWPYKGRDDKGYSLKIEQPRPTLNMSAMFAKGNPEWGPTHFAEGFVNFPTKPPITPPFDKGDMV